MTLKRSLLFSVIALNLVSFAAEAFPGGRPGGGRPGFGRPGPGPGPAPFPGGRLEQRSVQINRAVRNETLELRQLLGLDARYRGFEVQSVVVDVWRAGPRSDMSLLTDGRIDDTQFSQGRVQLRPRYRAVLGEDLRTLQLAVRGIAEIQTITVNLINPGNHGGPGPGPVRPGPGPGPIRPDPYPGVSDVQLNISRRMFGNDRLDITPYIDMQRLRGLRVVEIRIEATPVYNTALIDVLINSFAQGPSLQVDRFSRVVSVRPHNAVLGYGADNIVLNTRGDVDIRTVVLSLSR